MTLEVILGIAIAVALGIAMAPAVRVVLGLAGGILWVAAIFGGFIGAIVTLFGGRYLWPDLVQAAGAWWLVVPLGLLGVSTGALKLAEWANRPPPCCNRSERPDTNLVKHNGELMCRSCRAHAEHDDRLDDLLRRATATVADLHDMDEDWPNDSEVAELETSLRALGSDAEAAWQAYLRVGTEIEKAGGWGSGENVEKRHAAERRLLEAVEAGRERRRRARS